MDLYLDSKTVEALTKEAKRYELSSSALIRVLFRYMWNEDIFQMTISELREHVQEILKRENRIV